MTGGVTRLMLPQLPHTWGPPPPCKKALSKKQGKLTKRPSENSSRIANQNAPAKLASAEVQIRRKRYNAKIETVPSLIGACAFTGILVYITLT